MKKVFVVLLALPSAAIACGDLSGYQVKSLSFSAVPIDQAVAKLVEGTPFRVSFSGGIPEKKVNAIDVSGSLDMVLDRLAEKFGLVYNKNGCEIVFSKRNTERQSGNKAFILKQGDVIHLALGKWLRENGYVLHWEAGKYQSEGEIRLEKPVESTLEEVARLMKANGISINFEIYNNRVIRAMETKK